MKEKLSEKIFAQLRGDIIAGKYTARDFISESEIAERYGVSKAPVKDAMHLLADQGYLVSYPRKGYMVNTFTNEEVNQIQQIRRCLETLCVQLAIENATDEEIGRLRDTTIGADMSESPEQTDNYRFHMGLAGISGNPVLVKTLENLVNIASMTQIRRRPDYSNFHHIIDALLARNQEQAKYWIITDIADV